MENVHISIESLVFEDFPDFQSVPLLFYIYIILYSNSFYTL
jgi:hypothetical protein